MDKFGLNRKTLVSVISVAGFVGSIIFTTQAGLLWLDIVDHFVTHYGLVLVGIFECIMVGWVFNLPVLRNHINKVSSIQLGVWWDGLIKFCIPLMLGFILIGDLISEMEKPYSGYTWTSLILIGRDWLLLTLVLAIGLANLPWKTDHHQSAGRSA